MKRSLVVPALIAVVVVSGLGWLVLRWSGPSNEEEASPETLVAVRLGKVQRTTLRAYVTAYGVVEPEPTGTRPAAGARVTAAVPGVISVVRCVEGRAVKKGEVLFQLDSRVVDVAAKKAQQAVAFAETTLERQKKLIGVEGTSQKALQEAEAALAAARSDLAAAEAQQALLRVESPLAGTVTRVNVEPGQAVEAITTLAEVVDLGRLVVKTDVPAAELHSLHRGAAAEVSDDDASTTPVAGAVVTISPQVDPATGAAPVRVRLPADSTLSPGQTVRVRIVTAEHKDCLAVPAESVVRDESGASVVALVRNDVAHQTPVRLGLHDGDWIEVAGAGVAAGASVVTDGAYGLPAQTRVRVLSQ